jgi:acetyl-CoA acyltransferase 1
VQDLKVKHPDDVVIVCALRTALCKAGKGNFRNTCGDVLLTEVLKGLVKKSGVNPKDVEELVCGNVSNPASALVVRASQLMAGFPVETSAMSINR